MRDSLQLSDQNAGAESISHRDSFNSECIDVYSHVYGSELRFFLNYDLAFENLFEVGECSWIVSLSQPEDRFLA